ARCGPTPHRCRVRASAFAASSTARLPELGEAADASPRHERIVAAWPELGPIALADRPARPAAL
ncbi:MAG: hypothetical protein ACRDGT_09590, partial [Candidatus Limnocylindria bacterium]